MELTIAEHAQPVNDRPRFDIRRQALVGGRCVQCKAIAWPAPAVCSTCGGGAVRSEVLPRRGELATWSRIWVPADGYEPPYTVGMVSVGGVSIFVHVDDGGADLAVPVVVSFYIDLSGRPPYFVRPEDR